ncbi:unnamed protein product [Oppiella nova]|uniref:C2H2-type domain-containing protein n=1 Tax=Oppiella nova TaxID=334625 RepID=A0A7R9Q9B6_9ACAR|nr:unnamed protein product [Oppiella nova]CAG2160476.1 unnamed protein product [Oppiella nova]
MDADGVAVSADFYLRLAGDGNRMMQKQIPVVQCSESQDAFATTGDPEAHVVSEETQEVQTLDTEVDDRDRDETEGPEEVSKEEEGGESGVGEEDDREDSVDCEPIASTSNSGAKSVSNERPFVCFWPNCGKRFARKHNLKEHKSAVHLKLKRFRCDVEGCGQRFAYKSHLIRHKLKHSGEKPFKYDFSDCGKCFELKSDLNRHNTAVHMKEKRFQCDYNGCERRFSLKQTLIDPLEREAVCLRCMDCDKRFSLKISLKIHKNAVHLKLKPFVCDHKDCGKCFTHRSNLIRHERKHLTNK